jgi:hypothetical protein
MLLHAVLDPSPGERCDCGAIAVVVFLLPVAGAPRRIAWCGERCGACLNGARPTAYQLLTARRRLRRWWRTHNVLGEPIAADDEPTAPLRDETPRTR